MRSLYLVRHGKPQYPDEHSYCVGQTDFSLSMLGHLPVSYTHLDVYKRQYNSCTAGFICASSFSSGARLPRKYPMAQALPVRHPQVCLLYTSHPDR